MNFDHEQAASVYVRAWAPRTDAYTRWAGDHWSAVREPLTTAVVIGALTSGIPVSAYINAPNNTTSVVAFDIDHDDGWAWAHKLATVMWQHGALAYIERSRRGAHVWSSLDEYMPIPLARRAMRGFLAMADLSDPKIELRPAQDHMEPDRLGHALRMPTMHHPTTGIRYPLCYPDGDPLGRSLTAVMTGVDHAPAEAFRLVAEATSIDPAGLPKTLYPQKRRYGPVDDSASKILTELWGTDPTKTHPGKEIICPAHPDRHASLSILRDDQRVICHSTACDLHNGGRGLGTVQLRQRGAIR